MASVVSPGTALLLSSFALAARLRICKQAYVLIPVLLLIHFGMEEFSIFLFPEKHFRVMQFRNYLFTGFPFLCWDI